MIKTQIQLDEPVYEALKQVAGEQKRSMADCVREAVAAFVAHAQPRGDLADISGKFKPLPMIGLKPHDQQWAESIVSRQRGRK